MSSGQPPDEAKGLQPDEVVLPLAQTIKCLGGEIIVKPLPNRPFIELQKDLALVAQRIATEQKEIDLEHLEEHLASLISIGFEPLERLLCKLLGVESGFLLDGMRPVETMRAIKAALEVNEWPKIAGLAKGIRDLVKGSPLTAEIP